MDIKTRIRVALGIEEDTIALAYEGKLKDGTIIVSEADTLAEGVAVMVMTEDGTTIDVPVGSYEMEDGTTFVVEEEGIIASMGEAEEVEEVETEEEDKEEMEEMADDRLAEFSEVVMQLFTEMKEEIDVLKEELSLLSGTNLSQEEEIVDLQKENTELSKQLKSTPATENVVVNKFSKETSNKVRLSKSEYNKLSQQEKFLYDLSK